jgi:hypothetical protein
VFRRQALTQAAGAPALLAPPSPKCETAAQTDEPIAAAVPSVVVDAPSDACSSDGDADGKDRGLCWVEFETGFGAHRRVADPTAGDVAVIGRRNDTAEDTTDGVHGVGADWSATVVAWYVSSEEGDAWEKLAAAPAGGAPPALPLTSAHIGRFIGASVRFAPSQKKAGPSSPPTAAGDESGVPLLHFAQSAAAVGAFDPSAAADAFELVDMLRLDPSSVSLTLVVHPSDGDGISCHHARTFDFRATSAVLGPVSGRLVDPATDEFEADADDAAAGYSCLVLECTGEPAAYEQPAVILTAVEGWQVALREQAPLAPEFAEKEGAPSTQASAEAHWTFATSLVASRGIGGMGVRLRGWRGTFTAMAIEPSAVALLPLIPGTALQALLADALRTTDGPPSRWASPSAMVPDEAAATAATAAAVVRSALALTWEEDAAVEADGGGCDALRLALHQHAAAVRDATRLFSGDGAGVVADQSAPCALFGIGSASGSGSLLGTLAFAPAGTRLSALVKRQSRRATAAALVRKHFSGPLGALGTAGNFSCACVLPDIAGGMPCVLTRCDQRASITAVVSGSRVLVGSYRLGKRGSVVVGVDMSAETTVKDGGKGIVELLDKESESCVRLRPIALLPPAAADHSSSSSDGEPPAAMKPWTDLLLADAVGHALRA